LAKTVLVWEFDMYIAGLTPKSELTYNNLLEICQHYLGNKCIINVIDLLKNPRKAAEKQIMAIPTTIRKKPAPERILIGDLSNTERVILKLDLKDYQLQSRNTG
jgi:circadian clock protein KaiB